MAANVTVRARNVGVLRNRMDRGALGKDSRKQAQWENYQDKYQRQRSAEIEVGY